MEPSAAVSSGTPIPVTEPEFFEEIRRAVAGGWVGELTIGGSATGSLLLDIVRAAREVGKPLRVLAPVASADLLPPAAAGESWSRQTVHGQTAWLLKPPRPRGWRLAVKRAADLGIAFGLLLVLSPLMVLLGAGVWLASGRPIFYRWRVVGENGRAFTGYKFRTMIPDAERLRQSLRHRNEMTGPVFKLTDDPRITRVGRWLRKYSLDELPQLWNVLKGDMSLVGPRPLFREEYRQLELWQLRRLSVRPGLTCLWQVSGRNSIKDFTEWVRLDLQYIDRWSLRLDLAILARTVRVVFQGTGR